MGNSVAQLIGTYCQQCWTPPGCFLLDRHPENLVKHPKVFANSHAWLPQSRFVGLILNWDAFCKTQPDVLVQLYFSKLAIERWKILKSFHFENNLLFYCLKIKNCFGCKSFRVASLPRQCLWRTYSQRKIGVITHKAAIKCPAVG